MKKAENSEIRRDSTILRFHNYSPAIGEGERRARKYGRIRDEGDGARARAGGELRKTEEFEVSLPLRGGERRGGERRVAVKLSVSTFVN